MFSKWGHQGSKRLSSLSRSRSCEAAKTQCLAGLSASGADFPIHQLHPLGSIREIACPTVEVWSAGVWTGPVASWNGRARRSLQVTDSNPLQMRRLGLQDREGLPWGHSGLVAKPEIEPSAPLVPQAPEGSFLPQWARHPCSCHVSHSSSPARGVERPLGTKPKSSLSSCIGFLISFLIVAAVINYHKLTGLLKQHRDFPGGPGVGAARFHCRGRGLNLWSGN